MKGRLLLSTLLVIISINSTLAQFSVSTDFRVRSEYRDGARVLLNDSLNPAFVSSQRTRLLVGFKDENFEIKIGLQNARIWGQDDERANVPNFNLSEGWIKYHFSPEFSIKVGRQHLTLDDGRIFGKRNWNNIAVSHDLALAQYEKDGFTILGGGAYNNDSNDFIAADYKPVYYRFLGLFWLNKKFDNGFQFSVLHSTDANEDPTNFVRVFKRHTTGGYLKFVSSGGFSIQSSGYYQYGKHTSGLKERAYLFSIIPEFKVNDNLRFVAGYNHFSGNNQLNLNSDTNRSFNKLFGDGHKYYGYMDYFLNVESNTAGAGLEEMFLSAFVKTGEKSNLEISYHHFAVTGDLLDTREVVLTAADESLGSEIDLLYKHKVNGYLTATFGYSAMFASSSLEILKGGDSDRYQQWALVMLSATPELFNSKKKDN